MNRNQIITGLVAFTLPAAVPLAGQHGANDEAKDHGAIYSPAGIEWKDGPASLPPGAQVAILEGDPTREGPFTMRIRLPDGYHIPPHSHPRTERVTVISGNFKLAAADDPKEEDARTLSAGSYFFMPPGTVHAVWIEGETVIQLNSEGPWVINYVNPADDPRNG